MRSSYAGLTLGCVAPRLVVKSFAACLVFLAGVLALSAPARGAAASPFREVAEVHGALSVQSDGERFAWVAKYGTSAVRVFDTLRGRNFRLAAPRPGCHVYLSIGGGLVAWSCVSAPRMLLTDLSSGRSREPAGLDRVEREHNQPYDSCGPVAIGRQWLELSCGGGFGPRSTHYLNHRDGRLTGEIDVTSVPFIDLDYVGLSRRTCAPLERSDGAYAPPYFDYQRPFALHAPLGPGPYGPTGTRFGSIRLRRCGTKRTEILSGCPQTDCRTPQLGSDYVTWGEYKRVYAYLPRIRRRLLIGRAPAEFVPGRKLSVAHTCNRIFARWGNGIYAARFAPPHGAPPC